MGHGRAAASRRLGINLVTLLEGPPGDELPLAVVAGVATLAHRLTGEDTIALAVGSGESAARWLELDLGDDPTFADLVDRARASLDRAGAPATGDHPGAAGRRSLEVRHRELRVRLEDVRAWPRRDVRLCCAATGALQDLLVVLEGAAEDPDRRVGDPRHLALALQR